MKNDTITLPLIAVLIDSERGQTTIKTEVPEHEVPVLNVVHNGRVRVGEPTGDEIELDGSAAAEFARLERKYRRLNDKSPVRAAFPMGASTLQQAGFDTGRKHVEEARASIKKHPKPAAKKPAKSGE